MPKGGTPSYIAVFVFVFVPRAKLNKSSHTSPNSQLNCLLPVNFKLPDKGVYKSWLDVSHYAMLQCFTQVINFYKVLTAN